MADKMTIELALAHLEAGKFSFRMVDAIKEHIERLENELKVAHSLHAGALNDLRQRELANWRLEAELRKANARIHALLKTSALTEKASQKLASVGVKLTEYLQLAQKHASPSANTRMPNAFQELTPIAAKMGEYLKFVQKRVGVSKLRT